MPSPLSIPTTYTLVIAPEDERDPDPAEVSNVGQQVVAALQQAGWTVTPTYTGQRGSPELLFHVITQVIQTAGTDMATHQAAIDVIAALCNIFTTFSSPIFRVFHSHQQQSLQSKSTQPLIVTITIDGASISFTSTDATNDERVVHLAERFMKLHPNAQITTNSKVTVQIPVPKRKQHRRR